MSRSPDPAAAAARFLLGKGSAYTVGSIVQVLAVVVAQPFVTRAVGPEDYGIVAAGLLVGQVAVAVGGLGLAGAVTRECYQDDGGFDRARRLVVASALVAAAMVALGIATGPAWSRIFQGIGWGVVLALPVVTALPATIVVGAQALLRAAERPGAFVALGLGLFAGGQAVGLVLVGPWGVTGYFAGMLVAASITAVAALVVASVDVRRLPDRPTLRRALHLAVPTVPHVLAILVLSAGDRVVIERIEGLEAVGRYQVAYLAGAVGLTVLSAFNNAWSALVYQGSEETRWDTLAETTALVQRLAVAGATALALAAPFALSVLAPASFEPRELTPVTAIVAFSAVPYVFYLSAVHVVFQRGRTRPLAIVTPAVAVLNVCGNVVVVPSLGLVGAALVTVACYALWAVVMRRVAATMAEVPWRTRTALAVVAATAVLLPVTGAGIPSEGVGLWLRAAGLVVVAVLIAREARGVARRAGGGDAGLSAAPGAAG